MKSPKTLLQLANESKGYAIVKINESMYWNPEIIKLASRIDCIYMVNLSQPTHLCELSISFPAIALRNYIHDTSRFTEDKLSDLEREGINMEVTYFAGRSQFILLKMYTSKMSEEEVIEAESANPCFC